MSTPFDNGKPGESRGRKANGSKVIIHKDGRVTEKGGFKMLGWRFAAVLSILAVIMSTLPAQKANAESLEYIEKNGVLVNKQQTEEVQGKLIVIGESKERNIKILVKKEKSRHWHSVDVKGNRFSKEIWLTSGKGKYSIAVMIKEEDEKYSYGPEFDVVNAIEINKFLVPAEHIDSNSKEIIDIAQKIIKNSVTDIEKARAIYDWVVGNIKYDYKKYSNHLKNNFNNEYGALVALNTRKGVCYDFATLTAAVGRSAGLQFKVVEGEGMLGKSKGLHAWNEVFSSEENRWIELDTTFGVTTGNNYFDNDDFGAFL
jgi:protein-disulfide isomerase-like protein with CxxC motif